MGRLTWRLDGIDLAVLKRGSTDHGEVVYCDLGDHLFARRDRARREDRAGLAGTARGHRGCDARVVGRTRRERRPSFVGNCAPAAVN